MKKKMLFGTVLMIALVLALAGFAGAKGNAPEALPAPNGTLEFRFDGYCDGMTFNWGGNFIMSGIYASSCATCPMSDRLGGTLGLQLAPTGFGFTVAWESIGGSSPPWLWTVVRVTPSRTWIHYNWDGTVFNSGTWTPCAAGVQATGTVPSTAR